MFSLHPELVCNLTMPEQSLLECSTEGLLQDVKQQDSKTQHNVTCAAANVSIKVIFNLLFRWTRILLQKTEKTSDINSCQL